MSKAKEIIESIRSITEARVPDFTKPVDKKDFESFAKKYKRDHEFHRYVQDAGKGKVALSKGKAKDLVGTYKVFTSGKAEEDYYKQVESGLNSQIKEAIKAASISSGVRPSGIKYDVNIGDESSSVTVKFKGEELELDAGYFIDPYTDEFHVSAMEGASSWDWMALLGDEDSPWYDSDWISSYVDTEKAHYAAEVFDLDSQADLNDKLSKFLKDAVYEDLKT